MTNENALIPGILLYQGPNEKSALVVQLHDTESANLSSITK